MFGRLVVTSLTNDDARRTDLVAFTIIERIPNIIIRSVLVTRGTEVKWLVDNLKNYPRLKYRVILGLVSHWGELQELLADNTDLDEELIRRIPSAGTA